MKYLKKLDIKLVKGEYKNPVKGQVRDPEQVYDVFKSIKDKAQETLIAVYLGADLEAITYDIHSLGGDSVTLLVPSDLFGRGYALKSKSFILIHNHPTGNPNPSPADQEVMHELTKQSKIMKMSFLDFIIVGDDSYWSMFEKEDGAEYMIGGVRG